MTENGYAMAPKTGLLKQLRRRLFPGKQPLEHPVGERRSYLTTRLNVRLGWRDKLRVLVTGRFCAEVRTYTDVEVKDALSVSTVWSE